MFRPSQIRRYVGLMRDRGFPPELVLANTAIAEGDLSDPCLLLSLEQCQMVVQNMVALTRDAGLGFTFGMSTSMTDLGIVGHALMTASNMRQVIRLWSQFGPPLVGNLLRLRLRLDEHEDGAWTLRVLDEAQVADLVRIFCVEDLLAGGLKLGGLLAGHPLLVRSVDLAFPRPAHASQHESFFGCVVVYDAAESSITIESPILDAPRNCNDEILNEICVRHCQQVLRQINSNSALISRLRSMFLQRPGRLPEIDEAAKAMGISARTLRRQLALQQTTYQALLNRFRYDLAAEYLMSGHMTPKEVGYALGFQFTTTFRRAFRAWSGKTIGQYLADRQDHHLDSIRARLPEAQPTETGGAENRCAGLPRVQRVHK